MSQDASWLSTGWISQPSNGPNNLRYFRRPSRSRPIVSATRNRLLNCNPVPMTARETATKLKEIKEKYRIMNLEQQRSADHEHQYVPYVTKVQINLKPLDTRINSETKLKTDDKTDKVLNRGSIYSRNDIHSLEGNVRRNPLNLPVANELRSRSTGVIEPLTVESMNRQNVNQLIGRLYGQLSISRSGYREKGRNRPLASFARPTKGEIALMEKGMRPINPLTRGKAHLGKESDMVVRRSNSISSVETVRNVEKDKMRSRDEGAETDDRITGIQGRPISKSAPHRLRVSTLESDKCLCNDCKSDLKYEEKLNRLHVYTRSQQRRSQSTELTRSDTDGGTWWTKDFEERRMKVRVNLNDFKNYSDQDTPPAAPPSPVLE